VPVKVIDIRDYDPDDQLADEVRPVKREDALFTLCFEKGQKDAFSEICHSTKIYKPLELLLSM